MADNYIIKDGNGINVTVKAKDTGGGVVAPQSVPSDSSGAVIVAAAGSPTASAMSVQGNASGVPVPISAASLPLPTGAASAAKQPALGTAGAASADVISVQGVASMTPIKVDLTATSANAVAVKVDNSAVTQPANITQINGVALLANAGNTGTGSPRVTISTDQAAIATAGQGATGAVVPAGATYKGGIAKTALPSAASDGNLTGAMVDKFGRQVAIVGTIRDLVGTQTTTLSASTAETTIVTAAASVFNDLVMLIISNTSTGTNTRIDFRDTTAGTVLFSLQSNGGQPPVGFALPVPIPQTSVNTNWTAQCATSTTDVRIYAVFAKNK